MKIELKIAPALVWMRPLRHVSFSIFTIKKKNSLLGCKKVTDSRNLVLDKEKIILRL